MEQRPPPKGAPHRKACLVQALPSASRDPLHTHTYIPAFAFVSLGNVRVGGLFIRAISAYGSSGDNDCRLAAQRSTRN